EPEYQMAALEHVESLADQGIVSEYSLADTQEEAVFYAGEKGITRIDLVGETVKIINR
ncbi:MAG: hypothetical protein HP058_00605, partial [Massilimaliae sp.]|nr:hypothetical protein [Massiliimalia sp.]